MARLTHQEIDQFAQELGSFVRAGMPLPQALGELARQLPPGRMRQLSQETAEATAQGTPLGEALRKSSLRTPPEFIALVECGEITGDMKSILEYAMQHSSRVGKFRAALLTSVTYPVVLLTMIVLLFAFLANFVVPRMVDIFKQLGAELPYLTQLVVSITWCLRGGVGAVVIVTLFALLIVPMVVPRFRDRVLDITSHFPGFAGLTAAGDTAIYTRFLAEMLPRGVPLPVALRAAGLAATSGNTRRALFLMGEAAEKGKEAHLFLTGQTPSTAAFLFRQGEKNGRLAEACAVISKYCDERFDRISKQATAAVEPFLILLVALCLGFIVLSLYLPLFQIPSLVGR